MNNDNIDYYDESYYAWQRKISIFGGKANCFKFKDSVLQSDTVVDFGCGGGFLLNNIIAKKKIGIEPNVNAHQDIVANGAFPYKSVVDCIEANGTEFADVIISNHALEHTTNPLGEITELLKLLKPGGKIHFVVPCDSIRYKWKPNDINQHLFSWSPMNLGNLFTAAGYIVQHVGACYHKWPKHYLRIQKIFGWKLYHLICKIYCHYERSWFQTEVIATKETNS